MVAEAGVGGAGGGCVCLCSAYERTPYGVYANKKSLSLHFDKFDHIKLHTLVLARSDSYGKAGGGRQRRAGF